MTFVVCVNDFINPSLSFDVPIFAFSKDISKDTRKNIILIPDGNNLAKWKHSIKIIYYADKAYSWEQKNNQIFWRGQVKGDVRKKAVELSENHKFINAWANKLSSYDLDTYDRIVFSYHGLPNSHVDKVYMNGLCADRNCESNFNEENKFCYKAASFHTTKLIQERLGLNADKCITCFQSRLTKNWLTPFTDSVLEELAANNQKKILVSYLGIYEKKWTRGFNQSTKICLPYMIRLKLKN